MNQTNQRTVLWFVLLIVFTILVRAYGLDFPRYHWDENYDFNNVFSASLYNLVLVSYVHGSLHAYLILITWKIYLFLTGVSPTTSNLGFNFFENPIPLLLLARGLTVLISTGTVTLVFLLGQRLYNKRVGWLAAIFLAGTFLHAAESHYARAHVLGAFFIILVIYFCSKILVSGTRLDYILAGISVGLATAAQYTMAIAIVLIFYAHLIYIKNSGASKKLNDYLINRSLLLSINIAAITFFCVTPYALLDFQEFSREIKLVLRDVTHVWVDSQGQPVWLFYLTEHLRNGMGIALALTSIFGLIYAFKRRSQGDILLAIFPLISYLTLARSANFARYLIPILPPLIIFAAHLLDDILLFLELKISRSKAHLICILAVVLIMIQPVTDIIRFDYWLTQPDTRQIAVEWILSNIPPGSRIVVEGAGVLGPSVPLQNGEMEKLLLIQSEDSLDFIYTKAMLASQSINKGYTVFTVTRLDDLYGIGYLDDSIDNVSYYRDLDYDYLITSSWMQRSSNDAYLPVFQESLNKYYEPMKMFEPTIYFLFDPYSWRIDYQALRKVVPSQGGIGGPKLIIYKLRETDR